jgi:TolB protein
MCALLPSAGRDYRRRITVQKVLICLTVLAVVASLVCPGTSARAAFPGRNGVIAYEDGGGGSEDLASVWTVEPNGGGEDLLRRRASEPAFSPDGRRLAYVRGAGAVMLARADGSGRTRQLTHPPRGAYDTSPSWGPTTGTLVFTRYYVKQARAQVRVYRRGSSTRLTEGGDPAWSTRGTVAFVRDGAIYGIRPDGRGLRQVLAPARGQSAEDPDWSPDGRRLVFELRRLQALDSDIALIRADGTGLRRFTSGSGYDDGAPTFSPDGRQIAFSRAGPRLPGRLCRGAVGGQRVRRVTTSHSSDLITSPDWQPLAR